MESRGQLLIFFIFILATSKYVKKDKTKPIEEVIDVVGDFGPNPSSSKHDESRFSGDNESFGFDLSGIQSGDDQPMLQQQISGELRIIKNVLIF